MPRPTPPRSTRHRLRRDHGAVQCDGPRDGRSRRLQHGGDRRDCADSVIRARRAWWDHPRPQRAVYPCSHRRGGRVWTKHPSGDGEKCGLVECSKRGCAAGVGRSVQGRRISRVVFSSLGVVRGGGRTARPTHNANDTIGGLIVSVLGELQNKRGIALILKMSNFMAI